MPNTKKPSSARDASGASQRAPRGRKGSARHALLFGLKKHKHKVWWLVAVAVVGLTAVGLVLRYTDLSWAGLMEWIEGLNPVAVLPLMAILPIGGFPISVVYLFAGARFGPIWGGVVVAIITAIHLVGTYLIARSFLRKPLQRFIERRHAHLPHIPEDEQAAICLIAALVPGLPYVMRNYLLALADVKFKYYFWVCLPIYVARSYVTILLGDMSSDPSRTKIIVLIVVDVLKIAICAVVIWRLREHHRKHHGHEDDEDHEHDGGPDAVLPPNAAAK